MWLNRSYKKLYLCSFIRGIKFIFIPRKRIWITVYKYTLTSVIKIDYIYRKLCRDLYYHGQLTVLPVPEYGFISITVVYIYLNK